MRRARGKGKKKQKSENVFTNVYCTWRLKRAKMKENGPGGGSFACKRRKSEGAPNSTRARMLSVWFAAAIFAFNRNEVVSTFVWMFGSSFIVSTITPGAQFRRFCSAHSFFQLN